MKREEAKRRIECCRDFLANNYSDMGEPNFTAFDMALKALKQEPCEDCISRKDTIDWLRRVTVTDGITFETGFKQILHDIEQMPSVKQESKTDVLDKIRAEMEELIEEHDCPMEIDGGNDAWYREAVNRCIWIIDKYRWEG